jgi:hypothetical protein
MIKLVLEHEKAYRVNMEPWEEQDYDQKGLELYTELFRSTFGPFHRMMVFPKHMRKDIVQTLMNHSKRITREDAEAVAPMFLDVI